jgi:hypothetical protein
MKRKPKRIRKEPLHLLRNRCDALWREAVFTTHGVKCLVCNANAATQAHHIFHKGANNAFRFDPRNGLPICTGCHLRERFNPAPVVLRAYEKYGEKLWGLFLDVRSGSAAHTWTRVELGEVETGLKKVVGL